MTDAEENRELKRKLQIAKDALSAAWTDIGQWMQLANHQRKTLNPEPGKKEHPANPSEAGIRDSISVQQQISAALREMQ